jgi:hypothetical protein
MWPEEAARLDKVNEAFRNSEAEKRKAKREHRKKTHEANKRAAPKKTSAKASNFSRESSQSDDEEEDTSDKVPLGAGLDEIQGRIQTQIDNQQFEISDDNDDDLESVGQAETGAIEPEKPEIAKRRATEELSGEQPAKKSRTEEPENSLDSNDGGDVLAANIDLT